MSRAFSKERDDAPELRAQLERSEPYPVTAAGRRKLERAYADATDPQERARLERQLALAVVPRRPTDAEEVAFGASVTVDAVGMPRSVYTIVGDDEADIAAGKVGVSSPLAQALIGTRLGGRTLWRRPAGHRTLRIRGIDYLT